MKLDPIAILKQLRVTGATSVTPVLGGADTAIWRVEHRGMVYALRVFRPGQAIVCQYEVEVMKATAAAGIPVPTVHAAGTWRDQPALLLSWCAGEPLGNVLLAQPWRIWQLGTAFGSMQAHIHQVSAPPILRQYPTAWIERCGPDEQLLQQHLKALRPCDDALLHLDYHFLNVMADGKRITGVLDWANSCAGDPRADLARTFTILCIEPHSPKPQPLWYSCMRWLFARAWRRGYRQVAGEVDGMAPFYAWAGAYMLRDLHPRIERSDHWLQHHHLDPIRRWTAMWKRRAGIPNE